MTKLITWRVVSFVPLKLAQRYLRGFSASGKKKKKECCYQGFNIRYSQDIIWIHWIQNGSSQRLKYLLLVSPQCLHFQKPEYQILIANFLAQALRKESMGNKDILILWITKQTFFYCRTPLPSRGHRRISIVIYSITLHVYMLQYAAVLWWLTTLIGNPEDNLAEFPTFSKVAPSPSWNFDV